MIELSPEVTTVVMFGGILVGILLGFPLAFSLSGVSMIIGFLLWGPGMFEMFYLRLYGISTEYICVFMESVRNTSSLHFLCSSSWASWWNGQG